MNVYVKPLEKSRVQLTIDLPQETVDQWRQKAIVRVAAQVSVPGFRKGKVPEDVLLQQVGEQAIREEVVDLVIQNTYAQAVHEKNIKVIARPEKVELISFEPFKYEVIVAVYPEVKLKNYKKISVPKTEVQVEDKDVQEFVESLQRRFAEYVAVDRVAAMKDRVTIDFEGKDETGVVLDGTRSKNHPVVLGDNYLLPDFEKELVGMKATEEKQFDLTFPADYHAKHLIGKKVNFTTKVHKVEEVKLPEVNAEFIQKMKGKEMTQAEFFEDIRQNLKEARMMQQERERENKLLEQLLTVGEVEVPDSLIQEELTVMLEDYQRRVEQQGLPFEGFLKQRGKTVESLMEDWRKDARDRLAIRFILRAIVEKEEITVTDAEMESAVQKNLEAYPAKERAQAEQYYRKDKEGWNELRNRLQVQKVMEMLLQ